MQARCNLERSAERIAELNEYFSSSVLIGHRFLCPSYRDCSCSQEGTFIEGQLHHVGRFYDLDYAGRPMRVVIVGQEYGHPPPFVSLSARYEQVMSVGLDKRFYRTDECENRNPHMRGTTSALRLLHGVEPGADYDGEFIDVDGHGRVHLFDTFALVNYLLCSAIVPNSKRGISSNLMKKNCAAHFQAALRILSPTVIVVQGKGFWRWVAAALHPLRTLDDGLFEAEFREGRAIVVPLTHPSAQGRYNWGVNHQTGYLKATVRSALRRARTHLKLADSSGAASQLET